MLDKTEIINYLKYKIPNFSSTSNANSHVMQFSVHVYPFISGGTLHPFVLNLVDAIFDIEKSVEGYAKKTINWISQINRDNFEQVIQIFGEVLILRKIVLKAEDDSIILEPSVNKKGKNPEFRAKVNGQYIAVEVKTASLFEFSNQRQTGLQITGHMNNNDFQLIKDNGKVVTPRILKVKDFLWNAQNKFEEYKTKNEFENDYRLLFIIWDDYINEPVSALINPNTGLLTRNTFFHESNFSNIDGVFLLRHIHQFFRMLRFGELVQYEYDKVNVKDVFDYYHPVAPVTFVQNEFGREVPEELIRNLESYRIEDMLTLPFAEYNPTDIVDWNTGISLSGIYELPDKLRLKVFDFLRNNNLTTINLTHIDIALFGNINVNAIYKELYNLYDDYDILEKNFFEKVISIMEVQQQAFNDTVHSITLENNRRTKMNLKLKKFFENKYNEPLQNDCSCKSGKSFGDCCKISLSEFKYQYYHDL